MRTNAKSQIGAVECVTKTLDPLRSVLMRKARLELLGASLKH